MPHEDRGGAGLEGGGKWSGNEARIKIRRTRQSLPPLYESASSSGLQLRSQSVETHTEVSMPTTAVKTRRKGEKEGKELRLILTGTA